MSVWNTALGQNVVNNPLIDSPYVDQFNIGGSSAPTQDGILTEGSAFILIENGDYLTTE